MIEGYERVKPVVFNGLLASRRISHLHDSGLKIAVSIELYARGWKNVVRRKEGIEIAQPANMVLPCTLTSNSSFLTTWIFFSAGLPAKTIFLWGTDLGLSVM